jgi:hypothetical protein
MKFIAFLLTALPLLSAQARTGKDYAVFFYVTEWDDRRWPSLPDTKTECEKLRNILRDEYGFETEMVENPSKEVIKAKIRAYNARSYGAEDQVLFYFSMHGKYDSELNRGFLVAQDGQLGDLYGDSWYNYDDLGTDLMRNKCNHILLALDACHSGSFGIPNEKGDPGAPDYREELDCVKRINGYQQYKTRLYLCAGSKEAKTPGQSLFAARWLDALRQGGDGGIMTINELQFHLGKIQKPKYDWGKFKGDEGGDFVFIRKGACGAVSNDRDGDGVPNASDNCPDQYGTVINKGCPELNKSNQLGLDSDFDGIINDNDACPDQYGTAKAKGCPDADNDGVPDKSDKCKTSPGEGRWEGCPDTDADGLPDHEDSCPNQKGSLADKGCPPADSDRDGVPDKVDKCPDKAGKVYLEGCPEVSEKATSTEDYVSNGRTITGNISDASGEALIGATILLPDGKGTLSDVNGNYRLNTPIGCTSFEVKHTGYVPIKVTLGPSNTIDVKMEELNKSNKNKPAFYFSSEHTITGKVTDKNGDAMIGATVSLKGTTKGTATDINGNFALSVPAGTFQMNVSYTGYRTQTIDLSEETNFNIVLKKR